MLLVKCYLYCEYMVKIVTMYGIEHYEKKKWESSHSLSLIIFFFWDLCCVLKYIFLLCFLVSLQQRNFHMNTWTFTIERTDKVGRSPLIFHVSKKIKRMQSFQVAEKDERMEEHRPVTLGLPMKNFRLDNIQTSSLSHELFF